MRQKIKTSTITIRIRPEDRALLERAAYIDRRTITDFITTASLRHAQALDMQVQAMETVKDLQRLKEETLREIKEAFKTKGLSVPDLFADESGAGQGGQG